MHWLIFLFAVVVATCQGSYFSGPYKRNAQYLRDTVPQGFGVNGNHKIELTDLKAEDFGRKLQDLPAPLVPCNDSTSVGEVVSFSVDGCVTGSSDNCTMQIITYPDFNYEVIFVAGGLPSYNSSYYLAVAAEICGWWGCQTILGPITDQISLGELIPGQVYNISGKTNAPGYLSDSTFKLKLVEEEATILVTAGELEPIPVQYVSQGHEKTEEAEDVEVSNAGEEVIQFCFTAAVKFDSGESQSSVALQK